MKSGSALDFSLPSLWQLDKSLAEDSLAEFVEQAWHVIEPSTIYLHNWHIDLICEHLEVLTSAVVGDLDIDDPEHENVLRYIFNIPPRYMKSTIITIMWPVWVWIKHPWTQWIFSSYAARLSTEHSIKRRDIIKSDWYQNNWSDRFFFADDQNEKTQYKNNYSGQMFSTSTGGTALGAGGVFIVEDDPHNTKQVESETERSAAIRFHSQTLSTRLNDKKRGGRVLVMQRQHVSDVTGYQLEKGGWRHIKIPGEFKGDREEFVFPITKRVNIRQHGDLLWPEREGRKEMAITIEALGSYGAAGQYDQEPTPLGGGIIKDHWWRFWYRPGQIPIPITVRLEDGSLFECPQEPLPSDFQKTCQSWDMAFKDTKDSAYVVGQVWGATGSKKYLLDQDRKKSSFTESIQRMIDFSKKWPDVMAKLVEDKANGTAVMDALKEFIDGLIPIQPKGGKETRTLAVSPTIEAGNVYLPHPSIHPWVRDFLSEWSTFPGKYMDQVDSGTQALDYLKVVLFVAASGGSEHEASHNNTGRRNGMLDRIGIKR